MDTAKANKEQARKIIERTIKSGAIDQKMSIEDLVAKMGSDLDEVAGYVLAWDKYVLVVDNELITPEITFKK